MTDQDQLNIHENALLRLILERDELEYRINWQDELIAMQRKAIDELQAKNGINSIAYITQFEPPPLPLSINDDVITSDDVKDCLATLKQKADAPTARKLLFSYGVKQVAELDAKHYREICAKSVIALNEFLKLKGE